MENIPNMPQQLWNFTEKMDDVKNSQEQMLEMPSKNEIVFETKGWMNEIKICWCFCWTLIH